MAIATAQITIVDFNDVDITSTEPSTPVENQLWLDTSVVPNLMKRWDGADWIIVNDTSEVAAQITTNTNTNIEQTADVIRTEVSQTYTSKEAFEEYQSQKSTEFTQTVDGFNFQFNEVNTALTNTAGEIDAEVEERKSMIRFEDGNIIIGKGDSAVTLKLENDQIGFYSGGALISYWEVNDAGVPEFNVTDARILSSLRLGNFAFTPRSNGNLSFGKVG